MVEMTAKIKYDKKNYRKHPENNKRIIKRSLDEFGAGRSILIDNENEIIAGNGVAEQWGDKPIKIIETDGTELIAIKRTDLNTDDEKRKQLALIDNHSSDTSEFDKTRIKDDFSTEFIQSLNFDIDGYFQKQHDDPGQFEYEKIKWPITIVVDEFDYKKWENLKKGYNETNDLKLFLKILSKIND
jgi:hypothetical protein